MSEYEHEDTVELRKPALSPLASGTAHTASRENSVNNTKRNNFTMLKIVILTEAAQISTKSRLLLSISALSIDVNIVVQRISNPEAFI